MSETYTTRERTQSEANQSQMVITSITRTFRDSIRITSCSKQWLRENYISFYGLHESFVWKWHHVVTHFRVLRTFREHHKHSNVWKIGTVKTFLYVAAVPVIEESVLSASKWYTYCRLLTLSMIHKISWNVIGEYQYKLWAYWSRSPLFHTWGDCNDGCVESPSSTNPYFPLKW